MPLWCTRGTKYFCKSDSNKVEKKFDYFVSTAKLGWFLLYFAPISGSYCYLVPKVRKATAQDIYFAFLTSEKGVLVL